MLKRTKLANRRDFRCDRFKHFNEFSTASISWIQLFSRNVMYLHLESIAGSKIGGENANFILIIEAKERSFVLKYARL